MALKTYGEWKLYLKLMTSKRFEAKLEKEIERSMHASTGAIRGAIIEGIDKEKYKENSAFTVAMKKSSKPLVDKGDLRMAIRTTVPTWNEGFAGVLAKARVKGKSMVNIAAILHEGRTYKIKPKMRAWFAAQASELGMKPLSPSKTHIRIPGRPFVRDVIEAPETEKMVEENWAKAVDGAFNDTAPAYKVAL